MRRFVVSKLLQYVFVMFCTSVIIFGLVRLGPTDPVSVILGGKQSTPATIANIRSQFGLDKPVLTQYVDWIGGMLHGDFGLSYQYRQPVSLLLAQRLPTTLGIVVLATLIAIVIAIPAGVYTGAKQHSVSATVLSIIELVLVACPPFLTGILMIWYLSTYMPGVAFTGSYNGWGEYFQRISLPAVCMAFSMIALISRMMERGMADQLNSEYSMVISAKGASRSRVIWAHCFKNAVIPVITVLGLQIGILMVGSALVETVFSLPGVGTLLIDGVKAGDYGVVQAVTLLLVFVFMTISTILDLVYGLIDPRIREGKGGDQ
ncbi:peptide ABC transporter permease [Bifidobacterium goeldii]|uniref:Peptide ABC transporter permease n=1 Tax=Bifidobacterium goeldii TaxID=2306975 RepID=A0A430FIY1_9BIFI|nr:peptide ABC transporter permease [Bifidobacterium goeldii]